MNTVMNITNGDSAVHIMQDAGIPGDILPWRDVLHTGPVPDGLSLEELSEVRAAFISAKGWGRPDAVRRGFRSRDRQLRACGDYAKVILWFEHDLYDQLQLLQLLDWFYENRPAGTQLAMICTRHYLGTLTPAGMRALFDYEARVSAAQLQLASRAWAAFRAPAPEDWAGLLESDTSVLPFLEGVVARLLEEYPDCSNGLSRTAQQALTIISQGEGHPGKVFARYQETEERCFLGDLVFMDILQALLHSSPALLELPHGQRLALTAGPEQVLEITPAGREVLAGKRNWLDIKEPDCWLGGVHLTAENCWCRQAESGLLRKSG